MNRNKIRLSILKRESQNQGIGAGAQNQNFPLSKSHEKEGNVKLNVRAVRANKSDNLLIEEVKLYKSKKKLIQDIQNETPKKISIFKKEKKNYKGMNFDEILLAEDIEKTMQMPSILNAGKVKLKRLCTYAFEKIQEKVYRQVGSEKYKYNKLIQVIELLSYNINPEIRKLVAEKLAWQLFQSILGREERMKLTKIFAKFAKEKDLSILNIISEGVIDILKCYRSADFCRTLIEERNKERLRATKSNSFAEMLLHGKLQEMNETFDSYLEMLKSAAGYESSLKYLQKNVISEILKYIGKKKKITDEFLGNLYVSLRTGELDLAKGAGKDLAKKILECKIIEPAHKIKAINILSEKLCCPTLQNRMDIAKKFTQCGNDKNPNVLKSLYEAVIDILINYIPRSFYDKPLHRKRKLNISEQNYYIVKTASTKSYKKMLLYFYNNLIMKILESKVEIQGKFKGEQKTIGELFVSNLFTSWLNGDFKHIKGSTSANIAKKILVLNMHNFGFKQKDEEKFKNLLEITIAPIEKEF